MNAGLVYLAQSDTTAGLLSKDSKRLGNLKGRPMGKPLLLSVSSLDILKRFVRVPVSFRNRVRRARQTSFVYPNGKGIRVVKDQRHRQFLERFGALYSTSANRAGESFSLEFAKGACDVIVYESVEISKGNPSKIWHLGRERCQKIR
ncbi:MAG: Sua5/YciO/YrdC/YwlC family protein [Wolinella sp.]